MKWIKEINQKQEISLLSLPSLLILCLSIYLNAIFVSEYKKRRGL
jgi:hypothetical protein